MEARVKAVLELVKLPNVADRYPKQLSGGQRQRIAIARALVIEPSLLLLDEPLSNLDAKLREELRDELKRLHKEIGVTTIFVTHDQEEALSLSDRIVVMSHGDIEQIGTPSEIYRHPATEFVHTFIGKTNCFVGTVEDVNGSNLRIHTEHGLSLESHNELQTFAPGETVAAYVRPEAVHLSKEPVDTGTITSLTGNITFISFLGAITEYHVTVGKDELIVRTQQPQNDFNEGVLVSCHWKPEDLLVIRKEG
jgi:putative spermidine/putrescine transport system ATP-binding protein